MKIVCCEFYTKKRESRRPHTHKITILNPTQFIHSLTDWAQQIWPDFLFYYQYLVPLLSYHSLLNSCIGPDFSVSTISLRHFLWCRYLSVSNTDHGLPLFGSSSVQVYSVQILSFTSGFRTRLLRYPMLPWPTQELLKTIVHIYL